MLRTSRSAPDVHASLMAVNSWELWEQSVRGRPRAEAQVEKFLNNGLDLTNKARKVLAEV